MPFKGPLELIKMHYSPPQIENTTDISKCWYFIHCLKYKDRFNVNSYAHETSHYRNVRATALKFYKYIYKYFDG